MDEGLIFLFSFAGMLAGGAWVYRVVLAALRSRRPVAQGMAALLSLAGLLGGFAFVLGLLSWSTDGWALSLVGLVVLAPFAFVGWRNLARVRSEAAVSKAAMQRSPKAPGLRPYSGESLLERLERDEALSHVYRFSYRLDPDHSVHCTVWVRSIGESGGFVYLEGLCDLFKGPRVFRTDRIEGPLMDAKTGDSLAVERLLAMVPERSYTHLAPVPPFRRGSRRDWRVAVMFTGFSPDHTERLKRKAQSAGYAVRDSVVPALDVLVAGPEAGAPELIQAAERGAQVMGEEDFAAALDGG